MSLAVRKEAASCTAVYAKCRVKYASMLKYNDYYAMSGMKRLSEVAAYLVKNTEYSNELKDENIDDIHRGQLELLLYDNLFRHFKSLYTFTNGEMREFIASMMRKYNIDVILSRARKLSSLSTSGAFSASKDNANSQKGSKKKEQTESGEKSVSESGMETEGRSFVLNVARTDIDMLKVGSAQDIEQLGEALLDSKYHRIFKKSFINGNLNYALLEVGLYNEFYNQIYSRFVEKKRTNSAKSIRKLLYVIVDLKNLSTILRFKQSFDAKADKIIPYLLNIKGGRDKREYILFCNMSKKDYISYLRGTQYSSLVPDDGKISTIEYMTNFLYTYYRRLFRSPIPSVEHPFAYLSLKELEVKNLIHVIEGVRYGIPRDEIMKKIVVVREQPEF